MIAPSARRLARGVALALLAGACAAQPPAPDGSQVAADLRDPAALERGRRIFVGTCTGYCHAAQGSSSSEAPDLFDCDWLHGGSDAEIFQAITRGVPGTPMAGFAGRLDDRDIWRVIAWLRSASSCKTPG